MVTLNSFSSYESFSSASTVYNTTIHCVEQTKHPVHQSCALKCKADSRCHSFKHQEDECHLGGVIQDLNSSPGTVPVFITIQGQRLSIL